MYLMNKCVDKDHIIFDGYFYFNWLYYFIFCFILLTSSYRTVGYIWVDVVTGYLQQMLNNYPR